MPDDEDTLGRSLATGLGALVLVALVIGGLVSLLAVGALNVVGLAGSERGPAEEPTLYLPSPSLTPTEKPAASPTASPSATPSPAASATPSPSSTPSKKPKKRPGITLTASPSTVGSYEQINLLGSYPGGNGAVLQVQRREGGWVDFPTTATVQGGRFGTYVESGRTGRNYFRVVDEATGRASEPVTVIIR